MGIAMLSAMRSKDPNSQVGACIVRDNKILSLGYNGMPIGCDDDIMPWGREGNELETKYMYVCHSELNAILNAGKDLHGSTMYVTLFPCNECAKAIIQSGIKRIVYLDDKYRDANNNIAARHMFKEGGREIDSDTLKAMKCDGAREILAATGLGAETSAEMKKFIKKHERNPRKSWECERMRAAIPYLERIGM